MTALDTVLFVDRHDAHRAQFDEATHTWTVGGQRSRVIIASDGALPTHLSPVDNLDPYLGVAVYGVPNYFLITGPDAAAQKGYIAKCLDYMDHTDSTRIEVRSSTQRYFNDHASSRTPRRGHYWRRVGRRIPSAFEVGSLDDENHSDDAVYDGPAGVHIEDQTYDRRVRLTGHLDPIDGHYHWQGTIFGAGFQVKLPQQVILTVGDRSAPARLTEGRPSSMYSVVGVGEPPFELDRVELEVPLL